MHRNLNCFLSNCRHLSYYRTSKMFPFVGRLGPDIEKSASKSAKLLSKFNWVKSGATGTFSSLPPLQRCIEKLCKVIENEMNKCYAFKLSMPCLTNATIWKKTNRLADMGNELIHLTDRNNVAMCLSPTHEETITSLVQSLSPISYKSLPIKLYQIGTKFRDEMRPKNSLLRCREFLMKDLYSFDESNEKANNTYYEINDAYMRIFNKLNLQSIKVRASSGTMGGNMSHEYHLKSIVGEDTLLLCNNCGESFNAELFEDKNDYKCKNCCSSLNSFKSIEIGHTFLLLTKYSEAFNAYFVDNMANQKLLVMGCYGIGIGRLIAAAIEILSTENMLILPEILTPHQICVIPQKEGYKCDETLRIAENISMKLSMLRNLNNFEVVLDDRLSLSIGQRINEARNLGYIYAVVIGKKSLNIPCQYEKMNLRNKESILCSEEELIDFANNIETVPL